ncbi:hypothetical protein DMB72_03760 [Staphylococcus saccharolyticus]|nr:hypothetical protein DMB72_03760 [Staphylococcus saccharolyticus]TAB02974.1 hypothetical protein DMB78_03760 [Staphylococcus saccharolyticus]
MFKFHNCLPPINFHYTLQLQFEKYKKVITAINFFDTKHFIFEDLTFLLRKNMQKDIFRFMVESKTFKKELKYGKRCV